MSFHVYVRYTGTNSVGETRINQGELNYCQQTTSGVSSVFWLNKT